MGDVTEDITGLRVRPEEVRCTEPKVGCSTQVRGVKEKTRENGGTVTLSTLVTDHVEGREEVVHYRQ